MKLSRPYNGQDWRPHVYAWLTAGLLILATWIYAWSLIDQDYQRTLHNTETDLSNLTRVTQEHAYRTLHSADQALRFVKSRYEEVGTQLDPRSLVEQGVIDSEIFNLVSVIGANGFLVSSSKPFKAPMDLSDREHFKVHVLADSQQMFVSKPILGRASGKWSIQLTRRINQPDGRFGGVAVISIDPGYFSTFYSDLNLGDSGSSTLLGLDGIVRARRATWQENDLGKDISASPLFKALAAGQNQGFLDYHSLLDGTERHYHFRKLPHFDLVVMVGLGKAEIFAHHQENQTGIQLQAALVSLLLLSLAAAFSSYQRHTQQARIEAETLHQRLQYITTQVPGMVYQLCPGPHDSWACFFASDGIEPLLEISAADARQDLSTAFSRVHPEDRPRVLANMAAAAESQTGWHEEFRVCLPRGGTRWLQADATAQTDEAGKTQFYGYLQDITERRQATEELQEKTSELERFIYMISHDLKSPLVTIKAFLGYLRQDLAQENSERIEKDLGYMDTAASKMGQLLDELLELSRVGRTSNPSVATSFQALLAETLAITAGNIAAAGVKINLETQDLPLQGDRPRLLEIWQNLVENACKFMGNQPVPEIRIGFRQEGEQTLFFVADNGIGIDPRYHEKVFGIFEKLDPQAPGTGLGLALVKRIIESQHGSIHLQSTGQGQGSCFEFTLPDALSNPHGKSS